MTTNNYSNERKEVASWMRRLYKNKLTTSLGGNISLRLPNDTLAITTSATDKGRLKRKDIAIINQLNYNLTPSLKISMEAGMHIAILKRPDVKAIIHAHPLYASTFSAMEIPLNTHLIAEAFVNLKEVAVANYALPGSDDLANNVSDAISESNVIIMKNHGVLAVGSTLLEAFDRIEVLENAAKMTILTHLLQNKKELTAENVSLLTNNFG